MTPLRTLGRYEVLRQLGQGGMADVWLGRLTGPAGFERRVVLKELRLALAESPTLRNMFLDEARVVASIHHPNVVQVYELLELDQPCIVMELLDGDTLAALLRARAGPLPASLAAFVVAQACAGAHAAHELTDVSGRPLELVHRDLSPSNVFLTRDGAVKVLDFGIARFRDRLVQTEGPDVVRGTWPYMSPEQAVGGALDRRSDLFSLGAVLWECLTGQPLFRRETALATARALAEEQPLPPSQVADDIPPGLDAVCRKALEKDAAARYGTADDLRRELLPFVPAANAAEESLAAMVNACLPRTIMTSTVGPAVRPSEPWHKRRGVREAIAGTAVAATVVAAGMGISWQRRPPPPPAAPMKAVELPAAPPVATVEPRPAEAAPAAPASGLPEQVTVSVETVPDGAQVRVGGKVVGRSPVKIELPRSDSGVDIEAHKPGYRPERTTAVPSQALHVKLTLDRAARKVVRQPAEAKPPDPLRSKW